MRPFKPTTAPVPATRSPGEAIPPVHVSKVRASVPTWSLTAVAVGVLLGMGGPLDARAADGSCEPPPAAGGLTVSDARLDECQLHGGDSLTVTGTGSIVSAPNAVRIAFGDNGTSIDNAGTLQGTSIDGVFNQGGISQIDNRGTIQGNSTSITNFGTIGTLTNSGTLTGSGAAGDAIFSTGTITTLTNSGTINGDIETEGGSDPDGTIGTLNNSGSILGSVNLPSGSMINLSGSSARISGAVTNTGGAVNLSSGASFTTENTFSSATFSIASGATLRVDDAADTITVTSGAATAFNNAGTLRVAESVTAQINGNYTQSGALRLGASSNTVYGRLNVSGDVALTSAATFVVDVNSVNTLAAGQTLEGVIRAGGTLSNSAPTNNVSDNSALFNFRSRTDGTAVDLDIVAAGSPAPSPAPSPSPAPAPSPSPSPAPSPAPAPREGIIPAVIDNGLLNGVPAARVLDVYIRGGATGTDWDTVVNALGRLATNAEVARAAGQAMPLMHGNNALTGLMHSAATGSAIEQQLGATGQSGGDAPSHNGLWVKPIGNWVDQDGRDGASGYKVGTHGIVGGLQRDLNARSRLGFGLGYVDSTADGKDFARGQRSDIESAQIVGYGRYALGNAGWQLAWQGDYTRSRFESRRNLAFIGRVAQARFDGDAWHLGMGLSRSMVMGQGTLTPAVTLDWRRFEADGYTETGAGALNQQAEAQSARETLLKVGAQFAQDVDARTQWTLQAAVGYDLAGQNPGVMVRFTGGGNTFITDGLPKSRALAELGAGLRWRPAENVEVLARYALRLRKGFSDQSASVRLGWAF